MNHSIQINIRGLKALLFICFTTFCVSGSFGQTLTFNYSETAVVIDGMPEAIWNTASWETIGRENQGVISSPEDLQGWFKVKADLTNLYFLVIAEDDVFHSDHEVNVWNEDGVEIFIDVGNDKMTSYGQDDFQFLIRYDDAEVYEPNHDAISGTQVAQTTLGDSIIYEIAIPLATIQLNPSDIVDGLLMGFDIHLNDDDNHGARDGKLAWYARTDQSSRNPAYFGIASGSWFH